jgi:hypothetical protein
MMTICGQHKSIDQPPSEKETIKTPQQRPLQPGRQQALVSALQAIPYLTIFIHHSHECMLEL